MRPSYNPMRDSDLILSLNCTCIVHIIKVGFLVQLLSVCVFVCVSMQLMEMSTWTMSMMNRTTAFLSTSNDAIIWCIVHQQIWFFYYSARLNLLQIYAFELGTGISKLAMNLFSGDDAVIQERLRELCRFVRAHEHIADSHNVDFFTGDSWSRLPAHWQRQLLSLPDSSLCRLPLAAYDALSSTTGQSTVQSQALS